MTVKKIKDVESLDEIDLEEFQAGVTKLAEEAGDWRNRLPYEALVNFNQRDDVRTQFGEHVDTCKYCQELIEIFGEPRE